MYIDAVSEIWFGFPMDHLHVGLCIKLVLNYHSSRSHVKQMSYFDPSLLLNLRYLFLHLFSLILTARLAFFQQGEFPQFHSPAVCSSDYTCYGLKRPLLTDWDKLLYNQCVWRMRWFLSVPETQRSKGKGHCGLSWGLFGRRVRPLVVSQ